MLKDLLEYLAKSLVDNPDEVHVEATETDTTVVLELSVAKDDVGKVIGKQGRIAQGAAHHREGLGRPRRQARHRGDRRLSAARRRGGGPRSSAARSGQGG